MDGALEFVIAKNATGCLDVPLRKILYEVGMQMLSLIVTCGSTAPSGFKFENCLC